jgi:hypothetical protein
MIVSKIQKQPKPNKVVVVAPQASAARSATLAKVSVAKSVTLPKVSAAIAAVLPQVSTAQDRIRERAFALFEKRGSRHGNDLQDWFRAERLMQAR